MLDKIQDIFPQFNTLGDGIKFVKLMQYIGSEVAQIVGQFVKDSVTDRKSRVYVLIFFYKCLCGLVTLSCQYCKK